MSIQKRELQKPDPTTGRKVAYLVRVEGKRDPVTGKRRQYSKQVSTMNAAKALEAEWSADVARGTALDPDKTTVAELKRNWLDTKRGDITGQSIRDYFIIVDKHLVPSLTVPACPVVDGRSRPTAIQRVARRRHEPTHDTRLPHAPKPSAQACGPFRACHVQRLRRRHAAESPEAEGGYVEPD